jgi:phosphoenolpyruvate synthase/pyruvate phosphate dikinase
VFGISRDDAASFLSTYTAKGILPADPFISIDREGVGELIKIGVERGRSVRKDLKVGICGEHGGDPASVAFCVEAGLDYVSCSPFRVPIARWPRRRPRSARRPEHRLNRQALRRRLFRKALISPRSVATLPPPARHRVP